MRADIYYDKWHDNQNMYNNYLDYFCNFAMGDTKYILGNVSDNSQVQIGLSTHHITCGRWTIQKLRINLWPFSFKHDCS